jgi:hypothetical protein
VASQASFRQVYPIPAYTWQHFKADVLLALQRYYGTSVAITPGKKALKIPRQPGKVGADVVVTLEHREYGYFVGVATMPVKTGVAFWTQPDNQRVVNFPKQHCENGEQKNSAGRTDGRFKPTVRIFKNARIYLVERGRLGGDVAPSYFIECLLYNVPDSCFSGSCEDAFVAAWNWLESACNPAALMCQNGEMLLFGPSHGQWSTGSAQTFLVALKQLWENW